MNGLQRWLRGGSAAGLLTLGALLLASSSVGAATNVTLTVGGSGGSQTCGTSEPGLGYSWSAGTFAFGTIILNGSNQTATDSNTLTVADNSGCGSGWNVTATGTELYNGTNYIASAPSLPAPSWACTNGTGTCTLPSGGSVSYSYSMPVGTTAPTATKLVDDAAGSGMGSSSTTENISIIVPGSAYSGSYTATWTFTAVAGP